MKEASDIPELRDPERMSWPAKLQDAYYRGLRAGLACGPDRTFRPILVGVIYGTAIGVVIGIVLPW